jgi:ATP-dependent DNA helicase DinG
MQPRDFLPGKFQTWRPGQLEAVTATICADTRFVILNMPTGVGKSPAYVAASKIVGGRTLALTHTKGLQDQAMADFEEVGMRQIKGQMNYPCYLLEDQGVERGTCDEGPCHAGVECEYRDNGCAYYDAVRRAEKAPLVITNYSYWMHVNRYAEPLNLGTFDNLVLDEAHEAAGLLADFVTVRLDRAEVKKLLQLTLPRSTNIEEWVEWADYALKECRRHITASKANVHHSSKFIGVVRDLARIEAALVDILAARDWRRTDVPRPSAWVPGQSNDWVIEEDKKGITFQPVWPMAYSRRYLFSTIPRVWLVSATVTRKDANYLGVADHALTYKSFTSPFARKNRPVYYVPTVGVSRNSTAGELRIWMNRIDQIIEKEMGEKGIIHSVSYDRALFILEHSRFAHLMVTHSKYDSRQVIRDFKQADAPCILVSPSVSTGYDFPDEEARWQIIAKLPFVDNRPLVQRARAKQDRDYLNYTALVALIQMCGRGVRSGDDWCRTYIVDDNWRWFRSATHRMMPKWFKDSLRKMNSRLRVVS